VEAQPDDFALPQADSPSGDASSCPTLLMDFVLREVPLVAWPHTRHRRKVFAASASKRTQRNCVAIGCARPQYTTLGDDRLHVRHAVPKPRDSIPAKSTQTGTQSAPPWDVVPRRSDGDSDPAGGGGIDTWVRTSFPLCGQPNLDLGTRPIAPRF